MRTEFGVSRTSCGCEVCKNNCRHMPGFLIPADLGRMIPKGADEYRWAEQNLLASPGAVVMKDGEIFRISTLVPAVQANGACINLTEEGACRIHEVSPFGCAFFDCGPEPPHILDRGMVAVYEAMQTFDALYAQLWIHLSYKGLTQRGPEELRAEMRDAL